MGFTRFSESILQNKRLLVSLAIINFTGFLYGIYYYWHQLVATPFYLWIFTLDSPLSVLLFVFVSYFLYYNKKMPQWLLFLAIMGLVKYGFWTALVIIMFRDYFFAVSPVIYSINFPLHIGMILEGMILTARLRPRMSGLAVVLLFFLINDILDYFFGTLPRLPSNAYNGYLLIESFAMTTILPLVFYWQCCRKHWLIPYVKCIIKKIKPKSFLPE
ncbi:MAG: DUF1405 domain-containing protein [Candidatus Aenigmarchaeota archaeon]|nr:DUF1405 domain-containing protein [Candidatus Aenigmarchaeota archaeon]